jgi:hypothetical protein
MNNAHFIAVFLSIVCNFQSHRGLYVYVSVLFFIRLDYWCYVCNVFPFQFQKQIDLFQLAALATKKRPGSGQLFANAKLRCRIETKNNRKLKLINWRSTQRSRVLCI